MNFDEAMLVLGKHKPVLAERIHKATAFLEEPSIFPSETEDWQRKIFLKTLQEKTIQIAGQEAQREYVAVLKRQDEAPCSSEE